MRIFKVCVFYLYPNFDGDLVSTGHDISHIQAADDVKARKAALLNFTASHKGEGVRLLYCTIEHVCDVDDAAL